MNIPDPTETVKDLLTNNWNANNTDSIAPTIQKRIDVRQYGPGDNITIYLQTTILNPNGFGTATRERIENVVLDVTSTAKDTITDATLEAHFYKMLSEVDRIFNANILQSNSDFQILEPTGDIIDNSDKMKRIFWKIWKIRLINTSENV